MQNSKIPEICIDPSDFDPERLIFHDPEVQTFTIGASEVSTTNSEVRYLNDEGEECLLYFSAPPQQTFGPSYKYPLGTPEAEQIPDNAKGMQVSYPLTSLSTVNNPTEKEQAYIDMLESMWEKAVEKGREEADKEDDELIIPGVAQTAFLGAEKKGQWDRAVKKPAEHPKMKDKKTYDTTKPQRQYVDIITSGKGPTLKSSVTFYGPGDREYNPVKFIGTRGVLEPLFFFEKLYYGGHGKNSHGCSLKFKVSEANFTESGGATGVPSKRMLGKNTSVASVLDEDVEEDDDGTFSNPGEDDPSEALTKLAKKKAIAKSKPVAAKSKPATKKTVAKKPTGTTTKKATPAKKIVKKKVKKVVKKPKDEEIDEE